MKAKDAMISDLMTISEDATVREVLMLVDKFTYGFIPVVNSDDDFVGILYPIDLLNVLYPKRKGGQIEIPDAETLKKRVPEILKIPVKQIMNQDPVGVFPWTPMNQTGAYVLMSKGRPMPVVKSGRLMGMLTPEAVFAKALESVQSDQLFKDCSTTILAESVAMEGEEVSSDNRPVPLWRLINKTTEDKRIFKRLPLRLDVEFRLVSQGDSGIEKTQGTAYSKNISPGGLMLEFTEKVVSGVLLYVKFSIPGNSQSIDCLSRISWVEKGPLPDIFYAGLAFMAISSKERTMLKDYIDANITTVEGAGT